jgi:hypothetical protein
MAGKLDPVSQSFTADTDGYVQGMERIVAANIAAGDSIDREVLAKISQISAALGKLPDSKSIRITADTSSALASIAAVEAALGRLTDREVTVRVRYVTEGAPPDAGSSAVIGRSAAAGAGDSGTSALLLRQMQDSAASFGRMEATMSRVEEHLAGIRADLAESRKNSSMGGLVLLGAAAASLAGAAAADAASRGGGSGDQAAASALKGAVNLLAQGVAGQGGGSGAAPAIADAAMGINSGSSRPSGRGSTAQAAGSLERQIKAWQAETDRVAAQADRSFLAAQRTFLTGMSRARTTAGNVTATEAAGAGGNAALIEAAAQAFGITDTTPAPGGSGGPGAGVAAQIAAGAALGRIAGAGGAGLGGGAAAAAAAASGGGGGANPANAAAAFASAAGFVKQWYPAFHWAMMLSNELLATVGPAVVAGGAAVAVGYQGGQQVANRLQAIYSVAESLGPSLGMSAGQFLGGGNALQRAQNLGGGGVYELLGAGVNIAKSSASGAFTQLGLNTLAMIDRGTATLVQSFQAGMGTRMAGLVSGGTGYLQQFGDIAGNVGKTFLNIAPNLPGVGGDLLTTLQGGTKALAGITGWAGTALGPLLAAEAGSRYGPALVGGLGALLSTAGGGVFKAGAGLLGTAGGGLLGKAGAVLGDTGLGLARAGAFLGAVTAPELAVLAGSAYMVGKGITYQDPFQQQANQLQANVNQAGFLTGIPALLAGMNAMANVPYSAPQSGWKAAVSSDLSNLFATGRATFKPGGSNLGQGWGFHPGALVSGIERGISGFWNEATTGTTGPSNYQVAQAHLQSMADTFVNLLNAGQQVQSVWKGASGSAVPIADAYNLATMAQLQLGSAFTQTGKNAGQLTSQAKTMIQDLYAGYAPMMMNTGQFGAATGGVTAMQGLSKTQLSAVNSSLDQLVQIVSGGAAGTAAYSGLLQALPSGTASALKSFTSPAGSAAWTAFASTTQPSVISQLQQQTDWQRTMQTLGALSPGQTTGMTAYLLSQALPSARSSPAAMSMLSTIAQEYGGPQVKPGESAAAAYKSLSAWAAKNGMSTAGYNQALTYGTEKASSIPQDAQQFVTTAQGNLVGGMAQGIATYGSSLQTAFMQSVAKGGNITGSASAYLNFLKKSGVPQAGALDMASYAAGLAGAGKPQLATLKQEVQLVYKPPAPPKLPAPPKPPPVDYTSRVAKPLPPPPPHGGTVNYPSHVQNPSPPPPPFGGTVVYNSIVVGPGASSGIASAIGGGGHIMHSQTGGLVPGTGSGDIIPAMLEPGEAIVPRRLVPFYAPMLAAHRVPGFGAPASASHNFAAGGIAQGTPLSWTLGSTSPQLPLPAAVQQVLDQILQSVAHSPVWHQFGITLAGKMESSIRNLPSATAGIASALVNKVVTEIGYANNVAAAAKQGQGYGTQGLISGMDVTPGTGSGTVYEQMQSYLASIQSFTKDLSALSKGGLNKSLIAQMIAAGPVQGDALAQSVMGSYGGIAGVNQLWAQIGKASTALGAMAAMTQYGGHLSPTLQSGTIINNTVSISLSAGGGATLSLSASQIKQLTEIIEAKLLQQARRNQKTGVQAQGKSA